MVKSRFAVAALILLLAVSDAAAEEGGRVALVIGNDAYGDVPLKNARNDAEDLSKLLTEVGFDVQKVLDADRKTLERAVNEFIRRIPREGVALFHFSGHGIEIEGQNYLVPIGFKAEDAVDAKYAAYSAERILARMEAAPSRLNVIILDACRDNPYRSARSGARGLALMNAGDGSLISYATAPGKTASDNPGKRNGLFTSCLMEAIRTPGLGIEAIFKKARQGVHAASDGKQVPWTASSVIGEFVFREKVTPPLLAKAPENAYAYAEATLERFTKTLELPAWTDPGWSTHGMLEATHAGSGLRFVLVPGGTFDMGCDQFEIEQPVHRVTVKPFLLAKTECTQEAWDRFKGFDRRKWKGEDLPIHETAWEKVKAWCEEAGLQLPTEAEWEYACRAGSKALFFFGNDASKLGAHAWFEGNSEDRLHPVGLKSPNPWGFFDMCGNVWELCEDDYVKSYEGAPADGSARRFKEATHVVTRGGAYPNAAKFCRNAMRAYAKPDGMDPALGFRPAASLR